MSFELFKKKKSKHICLNTKFSLLFVLQVYAGSLVIATAVIDQRFFELRTKFKLNAILCPIHKIISRTFTSNFIILLMFGLILFVPVRLFDCHCCCAKPITVPCNLI